MREKGEKATHRSSTLRTLPCQPGMVGSVLGGIGAHGMLEVGGEYRAISGFHYSALPFLSRSLDAVGVGECLGRRPFCLLRLEFELVAISEWGARDFYFRTRVFFSSSVSTNCTGISTDFLPKKPRRILI
jgi:hypothetical protein